MSDDFERRLSMSLRHAADSAADATGLAQGARSRLRRRRRTTIAAAAAALVVVAVPVGIRVATSGEGGGEGAAVATDPSGVESLQTPAYRTESWRDATVRVPADWGYGALAAWCASGKGDSPQPVVQRPTTIAPMIACSDPMSSHGVQFVDARAIMLTSNEEVPSEVTGAGGGGESDYLGGTWSGFKVVGGTMVQVVAPDEDTAMAIYDSISLLTGPDANGCPQLLGRAEAGEPEGGEDISLCGYSDVDELEASRLLPADDGARLFAEIEQAPLSETDVDCPPGPRTVVLQGGSYVGTVDECEGVRLSGAVKELTDPIRKLTQLP